MTELLEQPKAHGPTYWFVTLDSALEEGDWQAAAEAAEELQHFGIGVRLNLNRFRIRQAEAARV